MFNSGCRVIIVWASFELDLGVGGNLHGDGIVRTTFCRSRSWYNSSNCVSVRQQVPLAFSPYSLVFSPL